MHYQADDGCLSVALIITFRYDSNRNASFKKENNGFLLLGQGLKIGWALALIGGEIIGILFNQDYSRGN